MEYIHKNLSIENGVIRIKHGDLAFKDNKIYCRVNHTINFNDMRDADFSVNIDEITKIIVETNPYVIRTRDMKYHVGKKQIFFIKSLDSNIYHITCTNLICKINKWFNLLKKDDIYAEIGVKYGAAAAGVLNYSKDNDLNIELNLFEKNKFCCEFLRERFENEANIVEGDATYNLKNVNKKFDFVFFDAHHIYNNDYPILESLIPYLKESTVIIFDDFAIKDVQKLVTEFKKQHPEFKNIYTI